ncbi:MAG: HD domain-containing protein [Desulfobacterales bacterium]|nr:HD domain-containing protein [Desulfobacterales bacterium]
MLSEDEKLDTLIRVGIELNQISDLDILLEQILTKARQVANADAGSIYIREGHALHFTYTQNATLQRRLPKGEKLIYSTFSIPIDETSIAGHTAVTGEALNIEDVYQIDPTKPFGFNKQYDEASGYRTRSVLTIPLKNAMGHVLGILQIINAQDAENRIVSFSESDEKMISHFAANAAVALERAQMTRQIILRMIRMAELRDPNETGPHVNRVAGYSLEIYEQWAGLNGVKERELNRNRDILRMAAMLHDVGKVAISDVILNKPAPLTEAEFEIMKQHTVLGARLFLDRQSDFDAAAAQVALTHHERWDGNGYPGYVDIDTNRPLNGCSGKGGLAPGKAGEEIPLFGRIVALADVFDALSSYRCYKDSWDEARVLETIEKGAGSQFDPKLVEILIDRMDILRSIQQRYRDA